MLFATGFFGFFQHLIIHCAKDGAGARSAMESGFYYSINLRVFQY
jgi:hypothetical protein